jgi:hypothetical protein
MDKSVYSPIVATLGFVCFTVAAIAVGLPLWGYFDNPSGEFEHPLSECEALPSGCVCGAVAVCATFTSAPSFLCVYLYGLKGVYGLDFVSHF